MPGRKVKAVETVRLAGHEYLTGAMSVFPKVFKHPPTSPMRVTSPDPPLTLEQILSDTSQSLYDFLAQLGYQAADRLSAYFDESGAPIISDPNEAKSAPLGTPTVEVPCVVLDVEEALRIIRGIRALRRTQQLPESDLYSYAFTVGFISAVALLRHQEASLVRGTRSRVGAKKGGSKRKMMSKEVNFDARSIAAGLVDAEPDGHW